MVLGTIGAGLGYQAGDDQWGRTALVGVLTAIVGAIVLPRREALFWLLRRPYVLLEEMPASRGADERNAKASPAEDFASHLRRERAHGTTMYIAPRQYGMRYELDSDGLEPHYLSIEEARYGFRDGTVDVKPLVQSLITRKGLDVLVNNDTMGGDPCPGAQKELVLAYTLDGESRHIRRQEHERLRIVAAGFDLLARPANQPEAELEFVCGKPGVARLRVTNTGRGAVFSATIQTYGLTAGAVEGRLVPAQWEETPGPTQRIARNDTRVLRLASLEPIAKGVFAWKVHRSDGESFTGVDRNEVLDVTLVADPDLAEPCSRRFFLHADDESTMVPGLGTGPVHKNPRGETQRITDMRRLLLEAAAYIRSIPYGVGDAKVAMEMSMDVKFAIPDFLGQAFGPRMIAVYGNLFMSEPPPQVWQEVSATFLMDLSQKLTQHAIDPAFKLPQTWRDFYASDAKREWRDWSK